MLGLGAGGNGSFAQVTALLGVNLTRLRITGFKVCVEEYWSTSFIQGFLARKGTHSANAWGFLDGKLKHWKGTQTHQESWSVKCFFSECGGGGDRWWKLYSLRREEIVSAKFSPHSKFISESLLSSWPPRVDGRSWLRVQHIAAERRLGSKLLYPREIKQDGRNSGRFQASYKEPNIMWLLITLTHTGSSWSSHIVSPKKENSRS